MHQHLRPTKRAPSAAVPGQSTGRLNSDGSVRKSSGPIVASETSSPNPGSLSENTQSESSSIGQTPDNSRLNMIIQHFFTKTALIVARNRVDLPQAFSKDHSVRLDKWFNLWVEDTNALNPSLQEWRTLEVAERRPEPLVMDLYVDTDQLSNSQALVALDDAGRRHDVTEYLRRKAQSELLTGHAATRLVYERWTVSLRDPPMGSTSTSPPPDAPPNTYKKAIVLLRSLFTYIKMLPGSKLAQRGFRTTSDNRAYPQSHIRIGNRVATDARCDSLRWPIIPGAGGAVEDYHFEPLQCGFGSLHISVTYRTNCRFEIDTAERLLSARLSSDTSVHGYFSRTSISQPVSLSAEPVQYSPWARMPEHQSYRAEDYSRSDAPSSSAPRAIANRAPPATRRLSTTLQPFKAGSLSSSPSAGMYISASPSSSLGRTKPLPSSISRETPLLHGTGSARQSPASASALADAKPLSITSSDARSPKPGSLQRYSSSFGNRKVRVPMTTVAKQDEDNASSGKGSVSSGQRASISLTDSEHAASATHDDSEGISEFLKMLDRSSKGLASLNKIDQASVDANSQRTVAQFSKFSRMRDSTVQLSESMSSSLMLQRSSGSLHRQYGSTGLGSTSPSSSISPGKPVSPQVTHVPAVPSRLSNASIAEYSGSDGHQHIEALAPLYDGQENLDGMPGPINMTPAMDIPHSPRALRTESSRRSSSANPQTRVSTIGGVDEDNLPFELRSLSLPNDLSNESAPSAYGADDDEPLLFAMGELGLSAHQPHNSSQGHEHHDSSPSP